MITRNDLRRSWRKNPLLIGAFALTTLSAVFFGAGFVYHVVYWSMHENEPIRPWMTVGYIGLSWDIKPRLIDDVARLPGPDGGRPMTLWEIAKQRGIPVETVIADVETAIRSIQARKHDKDGKQGDGRP